MGFEENVEKRKKEIIGNNVKMTAKPPKRRLILYYLYPKKITNLLTKVNLYDIMIANKYG